jgi:hypothetical protein
MLKPEASTRSPDAESKPPGWRPIWTTRLGKYGLGAVLAYGVCVLSGGQALSNELPLIIELGLVMGLFFFIVLGPAHLMIQFLGHLLISRFWPARKSIEGIILNVPALVIFAYLLIAATLPYSQGRLRRALQTHFDRPLPSSVHVNAFRFNRGMDHGSYTYLLSINPNELAVFLGNSGCTSLTNSSADLSFDPTSVYKIAGAEFVPPYAVYLARTNAGISHGSKLIIVGSNKTDIAFSESFH